MSLVALGTSQRFFQSVMSSSQRGLKRMATPYTRKRRKDTNYIPGTAANVCDTPSVLSRTPTANSSSIDAVDDPCWGGPHQHGLLDLLKLVTKSSCILYENDDFLVMNKPPDLRMDGPYPSTVHKLLTYWYPPPSIQGEDNLLKTVSTLAKHNDLVDNVLRPCHQLDYATSGVLCMARTKAMAGRICEAFANRCVQKVYLALVHGLVPKMSLPSMDKAQVDSVFNTLEREYRRTKANQSSKQNNKSKPAETFVGYLPPSAMFVKYKSWKTAKRRRKPDTTVKTNYRSKPTVLDEKDFESLCQESLLSRLTLEQEEEMLNTKWSSLRIHHPAWNQAFEQLASRYNDVLKEKIERTRSATKEPKLPAVFRVKEETRNTKGEEVFYIHAELAEVKNDFRVRLHPQRVLLPECKPRDDDGASDQHDDDLDYKPALTRCVVLERGYLKGQPVTKVRLEPRTGRRHQLRLHVAAIGHVIVGDVTYEYMTRTEEDQQFNICDRMCLHAYSLSMPISENNSEAMQSFVAPDPFLAETVEDSNKSTFTVLGPGKTQ